MFRLSILALFLAAPLSAQTVMERVEALERQTTLLKEMNARMGIIEADIKDLKRALVVGNSEPAPVTPQTKIDYHYEWRLTPKGQHALMRNDVQIGNWNNGEYHPLIGEGKWGPNTPLPEGVRPPKKEVKPAPAIPFTGWPLASAGEATAEGADLSRNGPLPKGFELPEGMKRYRRAAMTQSISILDNRDRIVPTPRLHPLAKTKWHQSGGLEGITGWRSDLYKNDAAPRQYVADISVKNSYGYFQDNRGWYSVWPDGARFMDVLSTPKGVFEVRSRRKEEGKWKSAVIYRDAKARPEGYEGLPQGTTCASCHNHQDGAGTGDYNGPLSPGSDTIFSFPIAALEGQ